MIGRWMRLSKRLIRRVSRGILSYFGHTKKTEPRVECIPFDVHPADSHHAFRAPTEAFYSVTAPVAGWYVVNGTKVYLAAGESYKFKGPA
jgi:hypothetical protein